MPKPTFVASLPPQIREELNIRLREAHYYGQLEITLWLQAQGFDISKSAVNRYALALRDADGLNHSSSHAVAARSPVHPVGLSQREQILIELGALREREAELLDRLRELKGFAAA